MCVVVSQQQLVFRPKSHREVLESCAMIAEGVYASGSRSGTLALWSMQRKAPTSVLKRAHVCRGTGQLRGVPSSAPGVGMSAVPSWITALDALPYCDVIASGSYDGAVRLWQVDVTGKDQMQATLDDTPVGAVHIPGFINGLKFARNGSILAVATGVEHRRGRWMGALDAKNKLFVVPFRSFWDAEAPEHDALLDGAVSIDA